MAEESAIEKKYIFYIAVDPEHLCIFDREKGEKGFWGKKEERVKHEKCRKCDWNEQIFWAFPWIFQSFITLFLRHFSASDVSRLKSVIFFLFLNFRGGRIYFKRSSTESRKVLNKHYAKYHPSKHYYFLFQTFFIEHFIVLSLIVSVFPKLSQESMRKVAISCALYARSPPQSSIQQRLINWIILELCRIMRQKKALALVGSFLI